MPSPKRVSSLLVTTELSRVSAQYAGLGFSRVDTGDPACIGYVAGETGIILTDREFAARRSPLAARCWGEGAALALADRFVPYVFVDAVDQIASEPASALADTKTWFGTRERVVQTVSGPVVFAEVVE